MLVLNIAVVLTLVLNRLPQMPRHLKGVAARLAVDQRPGKVLGAVPVLSPVQALQISAVFP